MINHNLSQFVLHAFSVARHFCSFCSDITRAVAIGISRLGPGGGTASLVQQAKRIRDSSAVGRAIRSHKRNGPGHPVLIHYHIFKNAGTSFEWAVKRALHSGVRRVDQKQHDGFVSQGDLIKYIEENPNVKVISTHQAAPPAPDVSGRRVFSSILLRDPIARIRSIYEFERTQASDAPGSVAAKQMDFKSYVEWRLATTPRMFCNFQVHYFRRNIWRGHSEVSQTDFERAVNALDAVDIVGTVGRYNEWLVLAESVLSENFGKLRLTPSRHNQTEGKMFHSEAEVFAHLVAELGSDLAQYLVTQNQLDMRLYQVADALLTRRLAERDVIVELRDAYDGSQLPRADRSPSS
jgi:hypothetical protein